MTFVDHYVKHETYLPSVSKTANVPAKLSSKFVKVFVIKKSRGVQSLSLKSRHHMTHNDQVLSRGKLSGLLKAVGVVLQPPHPLTDCLWISPKNLSNLPELATLLHGFQNPDAFLFGELSTSLNTSVSLHFKPADLQLQ